MAALGALQQGIGTLSTGMEMGMLEKAAIYLLDATGKPVDSKAVKVQFNPQSYKIQRGVHLSRKKAVPIRDAGEMPQSVTPEATVLSVQLIFDTYTEYRMGQSMLNKVTDTLGSAAKSYAASLRGSGAGVEESFPEALDACESFVQLIRFHAELHTVPRVAFVWGTMSFHGSVVRQTVNYTMFAKDGTPVRVALDLTIVGEESRYLKNSGLPTFQSPDRTKRKSLEYGESLWMMADREYGNPGSWKTIAQANGILNPRKLGGTMSLKVPSIR